jgi:hypothetical protein
VLYLAQNSPVFTVRKLLIGFGWVIDSTVAKQAPVQLVGVFTSHQAAHEWIKTGLPAWQNP